MKAILFSSFIAICSMAHTQSFYKPLHNQEKPVSVLNHKFDTPESYVHSDMSVPEHRTCLTPEINKGLQQKYNLPNEDEFEKEFLRQKNEHLTRLKSGGVITIPVIVHVIHNGEPIETGANISTAQVNSQIEVLNEDFRRKVGTNGYNSHPNGADIEIEFTLALRDEYGNTLAEPGIHRVNGNKSYWGKNDIQEILKPQTIWNPNKYMNIWTVNFGGDTDGLLGYAQFPSLSGLGGLENNQGLSTADGVIIGYKFFGRTGQVSAPFDFGRTTTHEVGHWLGLRHIWGDGDCSVDDYCDDTPKASNPNYGCPHGVNSCWFFWPNNDGLDMIENYMDYTDDVCMNVFTQDQKDRMQTVMQICPRRKELLNSDVHLSLQRPFAYFSSNKTEVCSGETIDFTDESINTPTSWKWTFYDDSDTEVGTFTSKNPSLTFNGIGVYSLQLIASNSFGSDTIYESNYISVLSSDYLSFPFSEDFEYLNALDKWVYYNPDGDRTWQETSSASSGSGTWSVYMDNYSKIDGDPSGKLDAFFSPKIDLSAHQNAYLTFNIAYAKYGRGYSDTLAIYVSADCGANFYPIWFKGGDELATAPDNSNSFVPFSSDWVTESISLKDFNGISDLHIAFVNWSGWGNNLYIDNINIMVPSYSTPSYTFFYTPNDTVSVGSIVAFSDYSTNYPTNWFWEFESGTPITSTTQNPYVTYNTIGTFDVKLTTSNASGGDNWLRSDYITIIDKPIIEITTNKTNNEICKGDAIKLTAVGADYYEWYDDRGYLISEYDSVTVYSPKTTTYEVIGYDKYGGSSSEIDSIYVNSLPLIDIGNDTTISITDSILITVDNGFTNYLWSDMSNLNYLLIRGTDYGTGSHNIYLRVTDNNGCQSTDSVQITINLGTSTIEIPELSIQIKVYPIPTSDNLNVESKNIQSPFFCKIYNLEGKLIKSILIENSYKMIDLYNLTSGLYNIRFYNNDFDKTIKILKTE